MNHRQIEVFKAVMETGSVTAASLRLGISQPAATKQLKLLELKTGLSLFARTANRLIPSQEANALFDQVEKSYRGLDHLTRFAAGLKNHPAGEISIAAMPMLASRWLPEILTPLLATHSNVSVSLPIRSSSWIADAVTTGKVDIGIGLQIADRPGIEQEELMNVPLVCAMRSSHPLAQLPIVTASDISPHTLITLSNFDQWRLTVETTLEKSGVSPVRRVDTFTTQVACELAHRGVGVAIIDLLTALDYSERGIEWRIFSPSLTFDIVSMRPSSRTVGQLAQLVYDALQNGACNTSLMMAKLIS